MPIGIIGWRAGIASGNIKLIVKASPCAPVTLLLYSAFRTYACMYLFIWISVFTLPLSVLISSFSVCLHSLFLFFSADMQSATSIFMKLFSNFLVAIWFFSSLSRMLMKSTRFSSEFSVYRNKLSSYYNFCCTIC